MFQTCNFNLAEYFKYQRSSTKEIRLRHKLKFSNLYISIFVQPESEFNEFEPRLKSAKNWFQFCAGLNLEALNTILCVTNHI